MAKAPAVRCRLSALLECSGVELTVPSCGMLSLVPYIVKAVVLAYGSETTEVKTMDESEGEKRRRTDREKTQ